MTTFRRRTAVAALLLVPALSACQFQTDHVYQPGVGVNDRSGAVNVLNSTVVSETDGTGVFAGTLVNTDNTKRDTLVSVQVGGGESVDSGAALPAGGLVNFATAHKQVVLSGDDIKQGGYVDLTFTFANGQSTTVHTPVVAPTNEFSDVKVPGSSGAKH